ncbi:MAG: DUF1254 domain-containing protein [Flavobacteriaceae bacterium]|jgi:hypothetical protein|nr:DUF1254 domain-containing protein [Flavobacteriaceae bacterium]
MKTVKLTGILGLFITISISCLAQNKKGLSKDEIISITREAYLFASPLIYTDVTRINSTFPDNYLQHLTKFPDHTFKNVVAPNNDTNYSLAFLELGEEPVVVEIPDTKGRYYVFPLQDAWTNNFVLLGKRTTGTTEQKYIITGPYWKGKIPAGLTQIKSPTNLVWIIGRIQVNSPEDQEKNVTPLQHRFVLSPLSKWQKKDTSAPVSKKQYGNYLPANVKGVKASVVEIVKNLSIENYFNYFNELLVDNPPAPADSLIIRKIAQVGIGAGKRFSLKDFDAETQKELSRLISDIYRELDVLPNGTNLFGNNTSGDPEARKGFYKTDYNLRALVAYRGLGALPPEEAEYYSYYKDKDGNPLIGKNNYRIHFEKDQLPPAQAFWSYTVYNKDRYLVENPIRRYAIGDRNPLKYNADGSLDIYLGKTTPGKDKESNWLPTNSDEFNITTRIYIPTEAFLKDNSVWKDPLPEKIN